MCERPHNSTFLRDWELSDERSCVFICRPCSAFSRYLLEAPGLFLCSSLTLCPRGSLRGREAKWDTFYRYGYEGERHMTEEKKFGSSCCEINQNFPYSQVNHVLPDLGCSEQILSFSVNLVNTDQFSQDRTGQDILKCHILFDKQSKTTRCLILFITEYKENLINK